MIARRGGAAQQASWITDVLILVALGAAFFFVVRLAAVARQPEVEGAIMSLEPRRLPYYAVLSLCRMVAAYVLSLFFALVYGYAAARNPRTERVLLPILDVLQSVPVLSFLPPVVLGLMALFPYGNLGVELATIVLIFTGQAWNLAFSFYHSLRTLPKELKEVAGIFHLNRWQQFKVLELPAAAIGLVWNSILSWANGWFFLMACEMFTLGGRSIQRPGLGSYLKLAASEGDVRALLYGLGALIFLIVLLDKLLWRPLVVWAERFKQELTASPIVTRSLTLELLSRSRLLAVLGEKVLLPLTDALDRSLNRYLASRCRKRSTAPPLPPPCTGGVGTILLVLAGGSILSYGAVRSANLLIQLHLEDLMVILVATGATFMRVMAAQMLALAWVLPLGVAIGLNARLAQVFQPIVQIVASIPATSLFPGLLLLLLGLPGGLNLAAISLMLFASQWYLLFNVIAGAMAIPRDLREVAAVLRIRGIEQWRSLILPAIFPYLVTGMIEATGGCWNAAIVAEYVEFGGRTYVTTGLGSLITLTSQEGNYPLLLASTLTMAATVVAINRSCWRRLYRIAEERYRLE